MRSKETVDLRCAEYRDKVPVITCVKSVTMPRFEHLIRVARAPDTGVPVVRETRPADHKPPPVK